SYATDAADALIQELDRDGRMLADLLRDAASTTVQWVTLPEPMALEETADAIETLERDGIRVSRLIVNRVTPPGPSEWCEARRRFERRALTAAARRFGGREILTLPDLGDEPRGVSALRKAAGTVATFEPPVSMPPIERRIRVELPTTIARGRSVGPGMRPEILFGDANWLLFGGKGGVGKTTCAAA